MWIGVSVNCVQQTYFVPGDIYNADLVLLWSWGVTGTEQFCHSHLFQHHSLADTHLGPNEGGRKGNPEKTRKNVFSKFVTPLEYSHTDITTPKWLHGADWPNRRQNASCRDPQRHKPTSSFIMSGKSLIKRSPSKDGQPWALAVQATTTCSTWGKPTAVLCVADSPLHFLGSLKGIISPSSQKLFLQVLLLKLLKELFIPSGVYYHWSDVFQCYLKRNDS